MFFLDLALNVVMILLAVGVTMDQQLASASVCQEAIEVLKMKWSAKSIDGISLTVPAANAMATVRVPIITHVFNPAKI